ncbi:two-component system response regulator [Myroides marinus]|uniref:Two-component system response regulator n=1 Tax=Myroides marinus TaxID=703342 RepID=A0A163XKA6_9FLAO|nr:LytTR family DNA-binding domain-containing protein [Myroides marinus]KUF43286.1 two-component system response regulator [Myroides marinus]KZE78017.1 two-component system response regulator [Myroides marinus]
MIRVLIVEDEQYNVQHLIGLLNEIDATVEIVAVIDGVEDCIEWLEQGIEVDLIFMDIRLSDGVCFEIFDAVEVNIPIVFTTAYDQYALQVFKVNSLDYLLKPIKKSALQQSLEKFKKLNTLQVYDKQILNNLTDVIQGRKENYRMRFLLSNNDKYKVIQTQDIAYIYTEFRLSKAVMFDKSVNILPFTMEELESELDPNRFFRASRQFLVSYESIKTIQNNLNSKVSIILLDDVEVDLSRERTRAIKQWLDT